jgi:hypothetical protein
MPWDRNPFKNYLELVLGQRHLILVDEILYLMRILNIEDDNLYPAISPLPDGVGLHWYAKHRKFSIYVFHNECMNVSYTTPSIEWRINTDINNFGVHDFGSTYNKAVFHLDSVLSPI